jgi:ATP-dependent protease ClpP protease subunit
VTASAASKDRGWAFSFRAQAAAKGGAEPVLHLDIYDVVGPDDSYSLMYGDRVSAKGVKAKLAESPNAAVSVQINSVGGDVTDGMAIYTQLNEHQGNVTVRVDGICASIASIIAMAADEIVMGEGAWMMIHEPYAPFMFDQRADDLESGAAALRKMSDSMATIYSQRTGQKKDDVLAAMKATTWMTAAEAMAAGYADKILPAKKGAETEENTEESQAMVASLLTEFQRVPAGAFMAMARAHGDQMKAKARTPRASAVALAAAAAVAAAATETPAAAAVAEETETETETEEETVESLKAKIKDLEAKLAEFEEGDEEEDPEASAQMTAIIAAAAAITGEANLAKLEGALYALERRVTKTTDAKAERKKLVSQLIANGKLAPARKDWATNCSAAALDAYIAGIGEQRIVQIGEQREPDEATALARTKPVGGAGAPEVLAEEEIVAKGLGLTPELQTKARENRVLRFGR